jgi:hypothetical protein
MFSMVSVFDQRRSAPSHVTLTCSNHQLNEFKKVWGIGNYGQVETGDGEEN